MNKKTVFITGAGSGIGAATALLFAQKGWFVGLFDIEEEGIKQLYEKIGAAHACYQKMDVTIEEEVKQALTFFSQNTGGRMDLLINNAGVLYMGLVEKVPVQEQKYTIDVNFWGVVNCTYQALPLLKNTPNACIVNVSSASSLYGLPNFSIYSATKHALRGLTQAWNIEFEHLGIKVVEVVSTFVNTPMLKKQKGQEEVIQRMGIDFEPEDIATAIWRATNHKKIHWILSFKMKILHAVAIFLPNLGRSVAKAKMMPKVE